MNALPRRVKGVVFDMDGLLVDTERVYFDALLAAAVFVGNEMPAEFAHSMIGVPGAECVTMIEAYYGEGFAMQAFSDEYDRLVALRLEQAVPLRLGARELVTYLSAQGIPQAIATSAGRRAVDRYMGGLDMLSHFAAVVTREDVAQCKPAPDPYLAAAERLGVAPEDCLALEDSFHGITSAHAAGMMPIMVPDMLTVTDEISAKCVAVVADLSVVQAMLEAQRATAATAR
jgi:HAD superfamily hydrolase (TIGR01509 family)